MDRYIVKKTLGEGGFGKALLAERKSDGERVVIKTINVHGSKKELEEAKREAKFLESLNHRNIVKYVEDFQHKGDFCIVMEHACGGDLHQKIRKRKKARKSLTEKEVMHVFVQICEALKECHSRNILHRDLKSQNIFLDIDRETKSIVVKLGDFGIARSLSSTRALARTQIGTPFYLSPEICNDKAYNHKTDIWALGCLLYEMCALRVPFEARDMPGLIRKIIYGRQPPLTGRWSRAIKNLIAALLRKDPKSRPDIGRVLNSEIVRKYHAQVEHKRATLTAAQAKAALAGGSNAAAAGGATTAKAPFRRQVVNNQQQSNAERGRRRSSAEEAARRQRIREREQAAIDAHQRKRDQAKANRRLREQRRQQRAAWGGPADGGVDREPYVNGEAGSHTDATEAAALNVQRQREREAQARATEAMKAKWAKERDAFLEGGGKQPGQRHAGGLPPSRMKAPAPAPAPMQANKDRPMTARERAEQIHLEQLRQARIQAFNDRQRAAAKSGRHYQPSRAPPAATFDSNAEGQYRHHSVGHAPPPLPRAEATVNSTGDRKLSAKEQREQTKLELLKQARIAAFQDRMRMAEKHRRGGAVHHHQRLSNQQQLQKEREQEEQNRRQRRLFEQQQQQQQQYDSHGQINESPHPGLPMPSNAREAAEIEKLEMLRQVRIQAFQDRQRMAEKHGRGRPTVVSQSRERDVVNVVSNVHSMQEKLEPEPEPTRAMTKEEEHLAMLQKARIEAFEERRRLQEQYNNGGRPISRKNSQVEATAAQHSVQSHDISNKNRGNDLSITRRAPSHAYRPAGGAAAAAATVDTEDAKLELLRKARIEAFEERRRLEERFRAAKHGATKPPINPDERPLPAQRKASKSLRDNFASAEVASDRQPGLPKATVTDNIDENHRAQGAVSNMTTQHF